MGQKFCANCGTTLDENELFCPQCGHRKLPSSHEPQAPPVERQATVPPPQYQQTLPSQYQQTPPRYPQVPPQMGHVPPYAPVPKKKSRLWIIILSAVLVVALGVGTFFLWKRFAPGGKPGDTKQNALNNNSGKPGSTLAAGSTDQAPQPQRPRNENADPDASLEDIVGKWRGVLRNNGATVTPDPKEIYKAIQETAKKHGRDSMGSVADASEEEVVAMFDKIVTAMAEATEYEFNLEIEADGQFECDVPEGGIGADLRSRKMPRFKEGFNEVDVMNELQKRSKQEGFDFQTEIEKYKTGVKTIELEEGSWFIEHEFQSDGFIEVIFEGSVVPKGDAKTLEGKLIVTRKMPIRYHGTATSAKEMKELGAAAFKDFEFARVKAEYTFFCDQHESADAPATTTSPDEETEPPAGTDEPTVDPSEDVTAPTPKETGVSTVTTKAPAAGDPTPKTTKPQTTKPKAVATQPQSEPSLKIEGDWEAYVTIKYFSEIDTPGTFKNTWDEEIILTMNLRRIEGARYELTLSPISFDANGAAVEDSMIRKGPLRYEATYQNGKLKFDLESEMFAREDTYAGGTVQPMRLNIPLDDDAGFVSGSQTTKTDVEIGGHPSFVTFEIFMSKH